MKLTDLIKAAQKDLGVTADGDWGPVTSATAANFDIVDVVVKKRVAVEIAPAPAPTPKPSGHHRNHVYAEPTIEIVKIPTIVAHGRYSTPTGRPRGVVQHYTAGALAPDAKQVIAMLTRLGANKQRLGCFGMDERGVIYVPQSLGFDKKGYHAGKSSWKGVSGMNSYLMGIEVCNPGKVVKVGGDWFAHYHVKGGAVTKGAKPMDPSRVRSWTTNFGKQSKGHYYAFTEAQERALINFALWQKKTNPEFSFDWVVGHDEISLSGKIDPGACLSMTMPNWREMLKALA